jgi:hypothetical protein
MEALCQKLKTVTCKHWRGLGKQGGCCLNQARKLKM